MKNKDLWIKKLMTGVLLTGLVLGMTACGAGEEAPAEAPQEVAEAPAEAEEAQPVTEESAAEASAEADTAAEEQQEEEQMNEQEMEDAIEDAILQETTEPAEISALVPGRYLNINMEGGTVEEFTYETKDYFGDGSAITKEAYIYLPHDYDPEGQYNVMILCHGIGGDIDEWGLGSGATSKVKCIMDNLVSNGDIEPFILVTPNGRSSKEYADKESDYNAFYLFGQELRNDLIPYINDNYATYGKNAESFEEARDHYAMAGLSMGGMQTINIGMCECLDIFSWFGAFSAAPTSYPAATIAQKLAEEEPYEIHYMYNICGTEDNVAHQSHWTAAGDLPDVCDRFVDGENYMWMDVKGGHDFNVWYPGFYNFAQIVFKDGE
jgi:enterochelin esterase-like enzyme